MDKTENARRCGHGFIAELNPIKVSRSEEAHATAFEFPEVRKIKSVATNGEVAQTASFCIVSFPGDYAWIWNKMLEGLSAACVFLPHSHPSFRQHAINP